ncbi:MAG: hypothetical protein RLZZ440_3012 [Planctomycetota bacterium]
MPAFDFPSLFWWGLPLVAAPLVIHLINLLRYRRVEWAAMEFLLASRKKYRTRALLRQLLLLAVRTIAVAGLVLALAQPRWRSALAGFLGGGGRHLVLLDDSYSMGDRSGPGGQAAAGRESAFDRGRRVVERLAADLAGAGGGDELALGLFSQLDGDAAPPRLLLDWLTIGPGDVQQVRDEVARLQPSWTAAGPRGPLAVAAAWGEARDRPRTAWIVSDFRRRDWQADETGTEVRRLADAGWTIRLVDCGRPSPAAGNLSITRLVRAGGVPAAGVIVPFEVEIRNDGAAAVRDLPVELREDGAARPGLRFGEIPPGKSVVRRFDVRFSEPGGHAIEARLPPDILPADDVAHAAVDLAASIDVLLICDDPAESLRRGDALYVATALAPGGGAATGLRPRVEPPTILNGGDLSGYDVIWLLDVARLEPAAIAALEEHARSGGGVVFACGPRTEADLVNRLMYRGGEGLFPVPLAGSVEVLPAAGADPVPDILVGDHPVVAVLAGQRNPLLDAVRIERVMAVERGFAEADAEGLRRLLSLRTGGPLLVERPFGQGLVAALLTTAAPEWNTWSRGNPSWVVVMLELQASLARHRRRTDELRVGERFTIPLVAGVDETVVDFLVPPAGSLVRQIAEPDPAGGFSAGLPVAAPGICTARWQRVDGTEQEAVTAVSLDPAEGRLERLERADLERTLAGVAFRHDPAEALQPLSDSLAGPPLARPLLLGLLAVLLLEQVVAARASYLPSPAARRSG